MYVSFRTILSTPQPEPKSTPSRLTVSVLHITDSSNEMNAVNILTGCFFSKEGYQKEKWCCHEYETGVSPGLEWLGVVCC